MGRLQFGVFPLHSYTMKSGIPEGSVLGPLLFIVFMNSVCNSFCNATRLLLADNFRIFHCISIVEDCKFLQYDVDPVYMWCLDNVMNRNVGKTTFILFFYKMNSIVFRYKLGLIHLTHIHHVLKILVVLLDSGFGGYNLHFFYLHHVYNCCLTNWSGFLLGLIVLIG